MTAYGTLPARALLVVTLVGLCHAAHGQTVYQWTDEQGTIHFSDQPPAGRKAEEKRLGPPPVLRVEPSESATPPVSPAGEEAAPRVVIERRSAERTGPAALRISGRLRNVGKQRAEGIRLSVSAPDPVQGNPCLEQEVTVQPDALEGGETSDFSFELEHPCLHENGETQVTVEVHWQSP